MSAVDRWFEVPEYLDTPALANVRSPLGEMDEAQRTQMRKAREWVDDALTHMPGRKTRPKTPDEQDPR